MTQDKTKYPFADLELARRLERTEARANADFVEARVKAFPEASGNDRVQVRLIAMMAAAPGSASQRNAERHGFRIAYTRTKWHLQRGHEQYAGL
jgi:hypothetical protein